MDVIASTIFVIYGHPALMSLPILITIALCSADNEPKRLWLRVFFGLLISTPLNWAACFFVMGPAGWVIFLNGHITFIFNFFLCCLTGALFLPSRRLIFKFVGLK